MDIKDVKDLRTVTITKEEYVKLGQINKYLPLPPKKVMMQMWRLTNQLYINHDETDVSYPVGFDKDLSMQSKWSKKIGQPYEFVYPEDVK